MAAFVFTDAEVVINSVDLSVHVMSVTLNYEGDLQEQTSMGDATRSRLSGLKDWSVEVGFKQDFAASKVDATLFSLIGAASVTVTVMADKSDGVSSTNPRYTGSAILGSYPPFGGSVGDLAVTTANFSAAGDLTRAVA